MNLDVSVVGQSTTVVKRRQVGVEVNRNNDLQEEGPPRKRSVEMCRFVRVAGYATMVVV